MFYNKINIMVPTYRRGATKLPAFVMSALTTAKNVNNLVFTVMCHEGDGESIGYLSSVIPEDKLHILLENEDGCNLSLFYNRCYNETRFKDEDTAVSMFGDDMVFVTKKWDTIILDKLNDSCGLGIVYGDDDNVQHGDNCVYFVTSRRLVEATGLPFMCELFRVEWIDTVWYEIGKKLNLLEYIPNLHIAHRHSHNPDVGPDKTFIEMRKLAAEADRNSAGLQPYVEKVCNNVRSYLDSLQPNVACLVTTFDRVFLLKKTLRSLAESVLLPKEIHVYDDGSVRIGNIKKAIEEDHRYILHENPHGGCEVNHKRAFNELFKKYDWVSVIDSDSVLYKFWWVKVCDIVRQFNNTSVKIVGLFNKGDRNLGINDIKGFEYKDGVGGIGMILSREASELLPSDDKLKTGWDNQACSAALAEGMKILATERSYVQHNGYIEGIHANGGFDELVCKNFCGDLREDEPVGKIVDGDRILISCMARKADIYYASIIVNALIEAGVHVTWLTIPHNIELIECLCPKASHKVVEPMSGDPYGDYSETTTYRMMELYPGFVHYVNLQMSSRENSGLFRNSDLTPLDWLKKKMRKLTDISVDGETITAGHAARIRRAQLFNAYEGQRVLILAVKDVIGNDEEEIVKIWEKHIKNQNAILLSRKMIKSARQARTRQHYNLTDAHIISAINESESVEGIPSWATMLARLMGK